MHNNPDQIGALSAFQELVERDLLPVVFENAPERVFVIDAVTMKFVAANAAARASVSVSLPKLRQMQLADLFKGTNPARINRVLKQVARRQSRRAKVCVWTNLDDNTKLEISIVFACADKSSYVVSVADLSLAHRVILQTNESLRTAIESLSDGFVLYDANDRLVYCNARYREIYATSAPAMIPGAKFEDILKYGLENGQYVDAFGREDSWLKERIAAHHAASSEVEQELADGRWLRIVERQTADGGRVGLRVDITTVKQQQSALNRLAVTEDLTGLLNRRGLIEITERLSHALRKEQRLAMFQIDLDRFKAINDVHGYDAGDHVLQHIAQILRQCHLRPVAIARVGADEFVLLLRTGRTDEALIEMARNLIRDLTQPIYFKGQILSVGASIGVASLRSDRSNAVNDMTTGADIALNQVKMNGGNDAALFYDAMRDDAERKNQMAEQIHLGLSRREFFPFFQPQIDTETGDVIGFEALIRWQHPSRGLVPAFQFLEIAQRSGLTEALDDIVMDRSCHAARQLLDWGMENPKVSINMSIAQVSDSTIVTRLQGHMKKHRVTSEHIRIELLESTLLDKQASKIVQNVHNLIAAGFPVELDDFGTGHAAIATLRQFAVSCIKIDRSLVQNIDSDSELQVITSAIINLGKQLGITVLAEGVETTLEQVTLQKMGCHRAQGYLHARPMPLDRLQGFLKERDLVH